LIPQLYFISFAIILFGTIANASELSCLGKSIEINPNVTLPFIELSFDVEGELKNQHGWFMVDTGNNGSTLDRALAKDPHDPTKKNYKALNFFNSKKIVPFSWTTYPAFNINLKQTGVIGTNVLSQNVYSIDFKEHKLRESSFDHTCSDQELINAGFVALSTKGYFSSDTKSQKLFPESHIKPLQKNTNNLSVPNIPTIPIKIGEVEAVAQIDSGFDDQVHPFSVNINKALLHLVNSKKERLVRITEIPVMRLLTCGKGIYTTITAYRLKEGETFQWTAANHLAARSYSKAIFFLKDEAPEALICGGIGTWDIPAAQIGVSFLKDMGIIIFNANTQTVWVPKKVI